MNEKLTEREKETLKYIIEFKKTNGYSPTVREIAKGINTKSTTHVRSMLAHLKDLEYITEKPKSPRTINVIKFIP